MAIKSFLAMEAGEPGYLTSGTVTHVPFPSGGNGASFPGDRHQRVWAMSTRISVLTSGSKFFIEFTSNQSWGVGFRSASQGQFGVYFTSGTGELASERRAGSDTAVTGVESAAIGDEGAYHRWGVEYEAHASTGVCRVFRDGVMVFSRPSGSTIASSGGDSTIAEIHFSGPYRTSSTVLVASFDSIVISDDKFLGDCHVDYLTPDSDFGPNDWEPSNPLKSHYELVNAIPPSDTDYVGADAEDLTDMYGLTNLPASGQILAVQGLAHAWKSDPGAEVPTSIVLETDDGEFRSLIEGMSTSMLGFETPIHLTKPGGGSWSAAVVNDLRVGVSTET